MLLARFKTSILGSSSSEVSSLFCQTLSLQSLFVSLTRSWLFSYVGQHIIHAHQKRTSGRLFSKPLHRCLRGVLRLFSVCPQEQREASLKLIDTLRVEDNLKRGEEEVGAWAPLVLKANKKTRKEARKSASDGEAERTR
jgi:hypothetical protein